MNSKLKIWTSAHFRIHQIGQHSYSQLFLKYQAIPQYFFFFLKIVRITKIVYSIKKKNSKANCHHPLWLCSFRFDQSTVELLLWYEAIFGKEMWKHVVVETSFWSHSEEAVKQRWNERGQVRYTFFVKSQHS